MATTVEITEEVDTYLDIQYTPDSREEPMGLLSWITLLAGLLLDWRVLSYPCLGTPQAFRDLPDDQASMGVPPHEEEISPMGYCRVSCR